KKEVSAVAFSPDERWFFTGDTDGRGIIWDAQTRQVRHVLKSHTGKISAAAFLPDGSRLLTASTHKTVAQVDHAAGAELLRAVLKHRSAVRALALVPNARQALTLCGDDSVRLWDIDKAQMIGTLPVEEETKAIAVSADGSRALTVHSEGRRVRLWEIEGRREI